MQMHCSLFNDKSDEDDWSVVARVSLADVNPSPEASDGSRLVSVSGVPPRSGPGDALVSIVSSVPEPRNIM